MQMTVKGVKLKSESFFSISYGVSELWRKNLREGVDRVKVYTGESIEVFSASNFSSQN